MSPFPSDLRQTIAETEKDKKNKPHCRLPLSNLQQLLKQYGEMSPLTELQKQCPAPADQMVER